MVQVMGTFTNIVFFLQSCTKQQRKHFKELQHGHQHTGIVTNCFESTKSYYH